MLLTYYIFLMLATKLMANTFVQDYFIHFLSLRCIRNPKGANRLPPPLYLHITLLCTKSEAPIVDCRLNFLPEW